MLVLSRRKNEGLLIDNQITVKILDIHQGWIKIGIEAPKNINILRTELKKKETKK
tara:strand:- start:394 stop:558 length:165 start_codon:yes stop_codon:yes gene_type:complete